MRTLTLTEQQINERLAMFLGWKSDTGLFLSKEGTRIRRLRSGFNFCDSRDAIQPVLEKLNEQQAEHLLCLLSETMERRVTGKSYGMVFIAILTLPPLTLAAALYEVIGEL